MVVAAYVVGGFLIASVYAFGMLRGPTGPLPPARASSSPSPSRPSPSPIQMGVGDCARPLGVRQPTGQVRCDRARPRDEQRRPRDALRPPELRRHRSAAASRSRAWRRSLSDPAPARRPSSRASTPSRPTTGRPTARSTSSTSRGTSWSGSGPLLFLLALWYWLSLDLPPAACRGASVPSRRRGCRRRSPSSRWRPAGWSARSAGSPGSSTSYEGRGRRHRRTPASGSPSWRRRALHRRSASRPSSCCAA